MINDRPGLVDHLRWLGHASFRIDQPVVIYIDPWQVLPGSPPADLILVSHEHHDHCSPGDVQRIRKDSTVVIANPTAAPELMPPIDVLRVGESLEVDGVTIEAFPAYNMDKRFHPREVGHIGFILTIEGERLYFAGDCDHIPEMSGLNCDVALLPVSGTYVMTAEEASAAAGEIRPKVAIPMHYGAGVVGTVDDAERFRNMSPVPVMILSSEGG